MKIRNAYLQLIRPKQWVKNGFVFTPLVFSGHLFDTSAIARVTAAFFCWCVLVSGIYILNDVFDREADRQHPEKRFRPLASGGVRLGTAISIAIALLLFGLLGSMLIGASVAIPGILYVATNLAYSAYLKRVVIIDVILLASGFVFRVFAGAEAIGASVSPWLVLCTGLLALFLGFTKRRAELTLLDREADRHRAVLSQYSPYFLDQMISVLTASTSVCYTLYTVSPDTVAKFGTQKLLLTVPFVYYGIFRYLYLVHQRGAGGNPTEVFLSDRPFRLNVGLWIAVSVFILYVLK